MDLKNATKALIALCLGVLGLALASAAQAERGRGGDAPPAVRAAVHADVTVINAKGESKSLTWDKGTVSAKSDTSITLSRKDGKSVTLKIDSNTKTHGNVAQGQPALVVSSKGTATAILGAREQRAPASVSHGPGRGDGPLGVPRGAVHVGWSLIEPDGKALTIALDRGEVTSVSATSITLKRPDNVSVTLKIDSNTKIHAKDGKVNQGDRAGVLSSAGTAQRILAGPPKS
jgi:hypothetical protein